MGTPLPPNDAGDNCFVCWGVDKAFGNTPTPRIITVKLSGLLPGDFWLQDDEQLLLTPHSLIQGPGPCRFQVSDAKFSWALVYLFDRTIFSILRFLDTKSVFGHESTQQCLTSIPNDQITPTNFIAYKGTASISWSVKGLTP